VSTSFEPGAAPRGWVPLAVPELRGNEWQYVQECLNSNWVSSVGPFVDRFERAVADRVGTHHAVGVVSGTAALHTALLLAGVRPDDEVLVSALTFIAPANAVRYAGAWPVFMDAEPDYWQMDAGKVVEFLHNECRWRDGALHNKTTGRRLRAIIPVHVLGHPVDLDPILEAARKFSLAVIEDAAESLGARYKGRSAGALADAACLSFNGNKVITTGGGGMLVTDNAEWAARAKYLTTQAKDDPVEYVHHEVGFNYRLPNVQAALGVAQMEQLDDHLAAKRRIAAGYAAAFAGCHGLTFMRKALWAESSYWLSTVLVHDETIGHDSRALLECLGRQRIQSRPLWQPLHHSRAHAGCQSFRIEVADRLHRQALSLPSSVGLRPEDQQRVIDGVLAFVAAGAAG
jgi:perosamine synthetase